MLLLAAGVEDAELHVSLDVVYRCLVSLCLVVGEDCYGVAMILAELIL